MAPSKVFVKPNLKNIAASTRSRIGIKTLGTKTTIQVKRKADNSPEKVAVQKRPALGEITNAQAESVIANRKPIKVVKPLKVTVVTKQLPSVKTVVRVRVDENAVAPQAPVVSKIQTRTARITTNTNQTAVKPKAATKEKETIKVKTRLSNEFEKTDESLYSSALEELSGDGSEAVVNGDARRTRSQCNALDSRNNRISLVTKQLEVQLDLGNHEVPDGVVDFDKENWNDPFQVSHYTMDIFNYLKSRESVYKVPDYMSKQVSLNSWMRALLVDWMVEIQESFELNHETLYLGVKLVDMYLSKVVVSRNTLQLVGAAGMFIASKYDERIPPYLEDFIYICDGAYTRKDFIRMEISVLKTCDFNLGVPLSYRFLRRYGRCAKISMPVLTLARFILEYSLMEYSTIFMSDSKLAAASLYLSVQMKGVSGWTKTLEFYSGYKLQQIISVVHALNDMLHKPHQEQLMTVRNKYSHKIFHEVAKTPLLKNTQLQV